MRIKTLVLNKCLEFGITEELFERLWKYDDKPLLALYIRDTCRCEHDLYELHRCVGLELSITQIRYLYYTYARRNGVVFRERYESRNVCTVLFERYPYDAFWRVFMSLGWRSAIKVAIEIMTEDEVKDANEIRNYLGVSTSLIYKVRKPFIKEQLEKLKTETI